ncbi:MAG: SpoIIE family protein phosphatase [Clostridiales bacterium]|nr:SpoIIE family protein phosphatase [Clostridiales bacterium]
MIKNWNYKNVFLQIMGIFVARANIGNVSPFVISFFVAMYLGDKNRLFTIICILFGLVTSLQMVEVVKYLFIIITILVLADLFERRNYTITTTYLGIIGALVTSSISIAANIFSLDLGEAIILALAEGIGVFTFGLIFRKGVEGILSKNISQSFDNEEIMSVSILLAIWLYGLPKLSEGSIVIQIFVCIFLLLYIGYKYGAGYGAIIGVTCGLAMSLLSGSFGMVSLCCILGILAGTFRELGRLTVATMILFGASAIFALTKGTFADFKTLQDGAIPVGASSNGLISKVVFKEALVPIISGATLFLALPESIVYRVYNRDAINQDSFFNYNIQALTKDKLREFSDSFHNLARIFDSVSTKKINLDDIDKENIFNELSEELCRECSKCSFCWDENFYDTYEGINRIMEVVETEGTIIQKKVPIGFRENCIRLERFMVETVRKFDLAKLNISCKNKLVESREAISEQFSQIGYILDDFSDTIYKSKPSTKEAQKDIISGLRAKYIYVDNITIFEKSNHRKEVFIYAHTRGGHCVTTREVAQVISDILKKKMIPSPKSKTVITKISDIYIFEEDSNFYVLNGVAKMKKDGSLVSGDNYSFISPSEGLAVMALSDGMGTGERAFKESEAVLNLLEQFIEVGFSKEAAIKLINSVMLIRSSENQTYSTVDMSVVNLYTGMCDFVKLGASTSFVKSQDEVKIIQSSALPIGMINQLDYEVYSEKLKDGDYVIMVTDGVIDSIPGDNKEKIMAEFIEAIHLSNPKEIANAVLNYSLELNKWTPKDDMTVLVGGFWLKE